MIFKTNARRYIETGTQTPSPHPMSGCEPRSPAVVMGLDVFCFYCMIVLSKEKRNQFDHLGAQQSEVWRYEMKILCFVG